MLFFLYRFTLLETEKSWVEGDSYSKGRQAAVSQDCGVLSPRTTSAKVIVRKSWHSKLEKKLEKKLEAVAEEEPEIIMDSLIALCTIPFFAGLWIYFTRNRKADFTRQSELKVAARK